MATNDLRNTIVVETKGIEDFLKFTKEVKKELNAIKKILQDNGFKGNEAQLTKAAAAYRREYTKAIKDIGAANMAMTSKVIEAQQKALKGGGAKSEAQIKELQIANEVLQELSKTSEDAKNSTNELTGAVDKLNDEQGKTNKTRKETKQLTQQEIEQLEIAKIKKREEAQIAKQNAIIKANEKDSIASLRAQLSLTTLQWSKLTAEEIKNTDTGKFLNAEKTRLTEKLKVLEKATGDHRREVGNYTLAGNKAAGMVSRLNLAGNKLTGMFGRIGRALDNTPWAPWALAAAAATVAWQFFQDKVLGGSDELIQKNKDLEQSIGELKGALQSGFREGRFLAIDNSNLSEAEKRLEKIKLLREDLGRLGVELSNKGAELQRVENRLIDDNFKTEIEKKQAQEEELQLKVKRNEIAKEIKTTEAEINKLQQEGVEANKKAAEDAAEKRKKEQEQRDQDAQKELERQRKIADELKKIEDSRLSAAEQFEAELRKIKIESLEDVTEKAIAIEKDRFLTEQNQTRDSFLSIREQRLEELEKLKELVDKNSEVFIQAELETRTELVQLGNTTNAILQAQEKAHQDAIQKIKDDATLEAQDKAKKAAQVTINNRREEIAELEKIWEDYVQNLEADAEEQIRKDVENTKKRNDEIKSAIESGLSSAFSVAKSITQAAADAENKVLEDAVNARQKTIDDLNERLKTAVGAERQFLEQRLQQEKEALKKQNEQAEQARREQAEAQRAIALSQAIVNIALGVTSALKNYPEGIPAAIAVGIAGAAEITAIALQKFAMGGVVEGNSHAQGGVRASVKGAPDVELEGGEIIINKNSARMFRKELEYYNVMGGGRKFQFGGDVSPNFQAIAAANNGDQRRVVQEIANAPIFVSVTDITNMQNRVVQVAQKSSF